MPNGPNCMSFLYRHLVIPDLAPPACKSNKFLFNGGTVTHGCDSASPPHHKPCRQNFASCSILARSAANCRRLRTHPSANFSPVALFFRGYLTRARKDGTDCKMSRENEVGACARWPQNAQRNHSKRRISTGRMRDAERAGKSVAAMLMNS